MKTVDHATWMDLALRLAVRAAEEGEAPVGALIVKEGGIVGKGYNQVETLKDPTAHAEILSITAAAATLGGKWLEGCTMYVTLEPCAMCAGAIVLARIPVLVFGAYDIKAGGCGSVHSIVENPKLNHRVHVIPGIRDEESAALLREFFTTRR